MWGGRPDPDSSSAASPSVARASELAREGIPFSTLPASGNRATGASIGKSIVVKGQIFGREDLFIDGEIEGTVEVMDHRLTIGPNGRLKASVKAREVVIEGTVHGNVHASERVALARTAKVVGDIRTQRIVMEAGAFLRGKVDTGAEEARPEEGTVRSPANSQGAAGSAV